MRGAVPVTSICRGLLVVLTVEREIGFLTVEREIGFAHSLIEQLGPADKTVHLSADVIHPTDGRVFLLTSHG